MADKERNVVHDDENWRQRLREEFATAKRWESHYGYLANPQAAERAENRSTRKELVKYYNAGPKGAAWTVKEKTVPLSEEQQREDQKAMDILDLALSKPRCHSNKDKFKLTNLRNSSRFNTTYKDYGLRYSLELFGVSEHAHVKHTKAFYS